MILNNMPTNQSIARKVAKRNKKRNAIKKTRNKERNAKKEVSVVKEARHRPMISAKTGKPILNFDGSPKLELIGYVDRIVKTKKQK